MMILGEGAVSYERGTPLLEARGEALVHEGHSLQRNCPPPTTTVGPLAWSYCTVPEGVVSYERNTPLLEVRGEALVHEGHTLERHARRFAAQLRRRVGGSNSGWYV